MSIIKSILQHSEHIMYFSGANNYCWAHFRNGEKKLLAKPISFLESQLTTFVRVHKTVLLNPMYVQELYAPATKKMAGKISLSGNIDVPVSRRRWPEVVERLQPTLTPAADTRMAHNVSPALPAHPVTRDIVLVTDDLETARLIEQTVRQHGTEYHCQISGDSSFLPPYLKSLSTRDQPILLLIDARTAMAERLRLLSNLKESSALCHLPIILLVATEPMVINGYQKRANSVLSFPPNTQLPKATLERVCHFWLHMASLPALA